MRYSYVLPALVATAFAQDKCGVVAGDGTDVPESARTIALALVAINSTTTALNQTIDTFQGLDQVGPLAGAGAAVLAEIQRQDGIVAASPAIPEDDPSAGAFALPAYVGSLACTVNFTVDNLIAKKQLFVDACIGPLVLLNIQQQQNASAQFQATVRTKIPPSLQDFSDILAAPIGQSLQLGADAFADQTALPASCTSTTTTTSATSTSTSTSSGSATTTGTQTGGAVYPTGTGAYGWSAIPYPTDDNNSYPPHTGGPYPTGAAYPTKSGDGYEEECDEEEYPTKGGDDYEEECDEEEHTTEGGNSYPTKGSDSYPTGGAQPTYGGDKHTDAPVWEPVYKPTGSANPSYPANPTWSPANPSYPAANPSYPVENPSYPVENPSYPVTTKPATKTATSSWAVWTTTSAPYKPVYTGAAVANAANGFGAVAFVVAAAAML